MYILLNYVTKLGGNNVEMYEHIKAFRIEILNMPQGELADTLGISQSCLSNYENGRREFPKDIIAKIGELANIPPYEFMTLMDPIYGEQKRLSSQEQLRLVKESQDSVLSNFYSTYENLFTTSSRMRDHVMLLAKLPIKEREAYLLGEKKKIKEMIKEL